MPIGSGIVYNTGDLILSQVSSSGTAFLETKIAAATSSLIYFDSTARINSASLNSITVGTASYVSGSTSIITNLTASNISASGTSSFGIVGIGTTNPAYKLDVNGNANFTNGFYTNTDASSTSYFVGANGTRPIIFQNNTAASYDFGFKFSDSNTFTIVGGNTLANPTTDLVSFTYDGKVGIGTTVPSALLHIYTGSIGSTAYPLLIDNSSGGVGVNVVGFGFANGGIMKHSITTAIYGNDYMAFNVGQGASYNQERMRIDSTGNVGIGTTTVSRKLHAYITTGPVMRLQSSGSNASIEFIPSIGHNRYNWLIGAQQNISDAFEITPSTATNGTTFSNPAILVKSDGNVGIGTTNPLDKLSVSGSIGLYAAGTTRIYNAINATDSISIEGGSGITFKTYSGGFNTAMFINTAGNVGIGITSPTVRLHVSGSSIITNPNPGANSAVLLVQDDGTATTVKDGTTLRVVNDGSAGNFSVFEASSGVSDFVILNNGNVGIGTSSPVAKLQVAGNVSGSSFTSSISNAVGFLGTASWANNVVSASFATTAQTANALNSANSYTITNLTASNISASATGSFGIVGIGTNSPGYTLEVNGTQRTAGNFYLFNTVVNPASNFSNQRGVGFEAATGKLEVAASASNALAIGRFGSTGQILDFRYAGTQIGNFSLDTNDLTLATARHLILSPTGNVGIGTTSPNSKLEVAGTSGTAIISVNNTSLGRSGSFGIDNSGVFIRNSNDGDYFDLKNASGTSRFRVIYDNATHLTTNFVSIGNLSATGSKLSVFGNLSVGSTYGSTAAPSNGAIFQGSVGIGTSNPYYLFDLYDTGANSAMMSLRSSGSGNARIYLDAANGDLTGGDYCYLGQDNSSLDFIINTGGNAGNIHLQPKEGTNNGILYVSGSTRFGRVISQTHEFTGSINLSGSLNATASWANNVVSASFATTAQTANALNTGNSYTITNLTASGAIKAGSAAININGNLNTITGNITTMGYNLTGSPGNTTAWVTVYTSQNALSSADIVSQIAYDNYANEKLYTRYSSNYGASWSLWKTIINSDALTGSTNYIPKFTGANSLGNSAIYDSSGNIGIGTTIPSTPLHVFSTTATLATFTRDLATDASFTIGADNNGVVLGTLGVHAIQFYTNATEKVRITSDGNVGIGTTSPTARLHVTGSTGGIFEVDTAGGATTFYVSASGNVGIGTANATDKLTLYGALASYKTGADTIQTQVYLANTPNTRAFNVQLNSGGTGLDLWSYNSSNAWLKHTTFNYDGNVGIGTAAPAAKLEITGSSNSALLNIKSPISGAILYVSGSGAVGIGTSNVGAFTLQVSGSFGATTKSFIIDHPTKAGKKLMYGSLESPYHGIRLTGRDTLVNGKCKVELPDYMYKLILHDSINIQLTGIKCNKTLYVDDINIPENYFTIAYDKAIFESYKDYDFFWDFTAIRADVPELTTEL